MTDENRARGGEPESRVRLRLSLSPSLYNRLVYDAEVLGLDRTTLAMFAFSLGLRALEVTFVRPDAFMNAAQDRADQLAEKEAVDAFRDAGIPVRRR